MKPNMFNLGTYRPMRYHYDDFEDMYRCIFCDCFFYPHEIGMPDNPDAGIGKR